MSTSTSGFVAFSELRSTETATVYAATYCPGTPTIYMENDGKQPRIDLSTLTLHTYGKSGVSHTASMA